MLATLDVPFDEDAARIAVDSAVESGQRLIVVSVEELLLAPMEVLMGWRGPQPEAEAYLAPAELAASLGVPAERLRVKSPHPVAALLELVAEREPGLVVFGRGPGALEAAPLPEGGSCPSRAGRLSRLDCRLDGRSAIPSSR